MEWLETSAFVWSGSAGEGVRRPPQLPRSDPVPLNWLTEPGKTPRGLLSAKARTSSAARKWTAESWMEVPHGTEAWNPCAASGQYERVGPRGGHTGHEVTVVRGEPLPPTPNPGSTYRIVDRTRNDSGRGK